MSSRTKRAAALFSIATVAVAGSQIMPTGAHATDTGATQTDDNALNVAGRSNGLDETTTLETCSANFGGEKRTVGFFHSIEADGSLNRAKSGKRQRLEYRVEDVDNSCVISDPEEVFYTASEVSCTDTAVVIGSGGSFTAPKYEAKKKHFKQYWIAPKGKNRCYAVHVNSLRAFFRTK
jgi:hypothetical protein